MTDQVHHMNEWTTEEHAHSNLGRADSIPHRTEGRAVLIETLPPPLLRLSRATVRKGSPGVAILDDLSLEIPVGEHTAILGPNGSGKSSLIRLITREYYPVALAGDEPAVQIFGRDRWDVFQLRRLLGIVTPGLDRDFSNENAGELHGLEAVVSGLFASRGIHAHHEVSEFMWNRARAALVQVDAAHLAGKPVHQMSTGEVRRITIARALLPDPPALLLDEPTAGLDIVAMQRFLETIRRLAASGKTIILVTHHLDEIVPEIRRVVLLKAGRIVADGPKEEILTGKCLSHAFESPLDVSRSNRGFYSVAIRSRNSG